VWPVTALVAVLTFRARAGTLAARLPSYRLTPAIEARVRDMSERGWLQLEHMTRVGMHLHVSGAAGVGSTSLGSRR
jgi:hypothetical protein